MKLLLPLFLFFSLFCFSQRTARVLVQGEVIVTQDKDREYVHIYNKSSEKGAVSDEEGKFTLQVALNDRILVSAIQFKPFTVVVDESILFTKEMKIYLNPYVNKLDEVVLSRYSLSGDLVRDAENIDVIETPEIVLTFDADADFAPDRFSRVQGNAAQEALGYGNMQNGFNFVSVIAVLAKAIFPKKKSEPYEAPPNKNEMVTALQQRFSAQFYADTFGISLAQVDDFIYFAEDNAITPDMLQPANEIELLETLFAQSELYKNRTTNE